MKTTLKESELKNIIKEAIIKEMKMGKIGKALTTAALASSLSGCGTANYAGTGIGYASNDTLARDKAYVAAGIDASRKNNSTFSDSIVYAKMHDNDAASEKVEVTQPADTETTFYENNINYNTKRRGDYYKTSNKFSGTTRKGNNNKD